MKLQFLLVILSFSAVFFNCSSGTNQSDKNKFEVDIEPQQPVPLESNSMPEDVIFYNILSPVDIHAVISNQNAYFNSSLLNPLSNVTRHTQSHKIALNLGVYGADLSYLWAFDQTQQGLSYLAAIQRLSEELGIPRDLVDFTSQNAETLVGTSDSLKMTVKAAYFAAERYLQSNERQSASSFILLGGWIETLYIATHLYGEPNAKFISKIATQKFSLNSLISLLKNHQNELVVSEYLVLLRDLEKEFDRFEVKFMPNNIQIDTSTKQILIVDNPQVSIAPDQLNDLRICIGKIRHHIIE